MLQISIIFPAHNEEKNIILSLKKAEAFLIKNFRDFEIIVVDDGSTDDTYKNLKSLSKEKKFLRVLRHKKNEGYGAAVWDGILKARGELIFYTDSDLQFSIIELKVFLKEIKNADAVIGFRRRRSEGWRRNLNASGWRLISYLLLGLKFKDIDCAFKLFKSRVIRRLDIKSRGAAFSAEQLFKLTKSGAKILQKPVEHFPRKFGTPSGANWPVIKKAFAEIWSVYRNDKRMVKSRSRLVFILAIAALFLSRLFLISHSADFFDAPEYLWRTVEPNLLAAISTGHSPFHPLYLFFTYLINRTGLFTTLTANILPSVIFGSLSVILIFLIVKKMFSSGIAWLTAIFFAITPFVFVSQITALIDPTMQFFYFLSLYFLILTLERKRGEYWYAVLSGLAFGLSAFAHTQIAFWVSGFLAVFIIQNRDFSRENLKKLLLKLILFCLGSGIFLFLYLRLLIYASARENLHVSNYYQALRLMLFDNTGEKNPLSIYEAIKRFATISTGIAFVLGIFGAIRMFLKGSKRETVALLIWLLPVILTSAYIYENLHGRAMMIGLLPLFIFVSYLILNLRPTLGFILSGLLVVQLMIITVPLVISYHQAGSPNEILAAYEREAEPDGVFIFSNVTRTLADYNGTMIGLGDQTAGGFEKKVSEALDAGHPAYISADAIRYPFNRYDGRNFDIRSTGVPQISFTLASNLFNSNSLTISRVSDQFVQYIYGISKSKPSDYLAKVAAAVGGKNIIFGRIVSDNQPVSALSVGLYKPSVCKSSAEDWTHLDGLFCLVKNLKGVQAPIDWTYTDRDGSFYLPEEKGDFELKFGPTETDTRSNDLNGQFPIQEAIDSKANFVANYSDLSALQSALDQINGSYYVVAEKDSGRLNFALYAEDFILPKTDVLEAENMAGQIGGVKKLSKASGGFVRSNVSDKAGGYLISGPYVDLPKGNYSVEFHLHAKPTENPDSILNFDVYSGTDNKAYGSKTVLARDLDKNDFLTVRIDFSLEKETDSLEFRLNVGGDVKTEVDYLRLLR